MGGPYRAGGSGKLPFVKEDAYFSFAASNSFATDILGGDRYNRREEEFQYTKMRCSLL